MGKKNRKLKLFFRYFWIFLIGSIVGFLYENIYKLDNIEKAFNEVCRNTKNKRKCC